MMLHQACQLNQHQSQRRLLPCPRYIDPRAIEQKGRSSRPFGDEQEESMHIMAQHADRAALQRQRDRGEV